MSLTSNKINKLTIKETAVKENSCYPIKDNIWRRPSLQIHRVINERMIAHTQSYGPYENCFYVALRFVLCSCNYNKGLAGKIMLKESDPIIILQRIKHNRIER